MTARQYRIALVQMSMTSDTDGNLDRAMSRIEDAAKDDAQIVCLPELFRSLYFCQNEDAACFDLAEPIPGPTTEALSEVAQRCGVVVIAPVFERRAAGVYHNSVAVIDADGSIAGTYRKMHIPDDPSYYEKFYFTPGDLGFRAFDTKVGRIGVLICWDQWYPEAARLVTLQGADVIFYPTAIGWLPEDKKEAGAAQLDAWRTVQRGHAIANGVYVAAANRVGFEESGKGQGIEFWGNSFLAGPQGEMIAQAGDGDETVYANLDLTHLEDVRRNWPFLRDRRIDAFGGIASRFLDGEAGGQEE